MPIYEFKCQDCNHRFEKLCAIGENGEKLICPDCGALHPQRVFSTFCSSSKGNNSNNLSYSGGSGCHSCSSSNCGSCRH